MMSTNDTEGILLEIPTLSKQNSSKGRSRFYSSMTCNQYKQDFRCPQTPKLMPMIRELDPEMLDASFSLEPTQQQELDMVNDNMQKLNIMKKQNSRERIYSENLCDFMYRN